MKKALGIGLLIIALVTVGMATTATAQVWSTGIQVQNLSSTQAAQVTLVFYNQNGTTADTVTDTIPAGSSKTYYQPSQTTLPSGFVGSVVVSSDQPVAAIVNQNSTGTVMSGSYVGASAGASPVYLPLMMKSNYGWNTEFAVQNAGASPTAVTITYYNMSGTVVNTDTTSASNLAQGASVIVKQINNASLPAGFVGSAVLTASQPLVAVVNQSNGKVTMTYNGFTGGGLSVYVPLAMKSNYGWQTGIQVANLSLSSSTVVTGTYYAAGSTTPTATEVQTIPAGSSKTFYQPSNANLPNRFVGSVIFQSSSQNIAAIVNQENGHTASGGNGTQGMAYEGFTTGTDQVSLPLVMKGNYGWYTAFQVQNVGSGTTNLTVRYYRSGETTPTATNTSVSLAGGSSYTFYQPTDGSIPSPFVGSVVIEASDSVPIVAICNENYSGTSAGETSMSYVGFNQ